MVEHVWVIKVGRVPRCWGMARARLALRMPWLSEISSAKTGSTICIWAVHDMQGSGKMWSCISSMFVWMYAYACALKWNKYELGRERSNNSLGASFSWVIDGRKKCLRHTPRHGVSVHFIACTSATTTFPVYVCPPLCLCLHLTPVQWITRSVN